MAATFPAIINTVPFKGWMTVILIATKTDTLLQGMDGCNYIGEISRLPFKKLIASDRSSKKVAVLNPFSTRGFLTFSGGIEMEHCLKMG